MVQEERTAFALKQPHKPNVVGGNAAIMKLVNSSLDECPTSQFWNP